MIHYRLLRDNKETGPFSEEEMIAKGFKPYDLLWAEGKSAGWQYPSEIPAFKKYAPIVEEQPYDRFYKKQPAQKVLTAEERNSPFSYQSNTQKTKETNTQQPPVQAARPNYQYNVEDLPARHIHVTLPSGNTVNLTALATKKEVTADKVADSNQLQQEKKEVPVFAEKKSSFSTGAIADTASGSIVTYAGFDNTGENNIAASAAYPAYQRNNSDFSWTLLLGAIVGIATLVGLGIMIGLSMNRDKNDRAFNEALLNKSKQTPVTDRYTPPETVANNNQPVVQSIVPAPVVNKQLAGSNKNKSLVQNAVVKTVVTPDNTKEERPVEKPVVEKTNPIQHLEEVSMHSKPAVAAASTALIEKSLKMSANDFKAGAFGGITNLKYTLFNGSKSSLESVEVEVDYIQANNKVYKTETLLFKDVAAGAQLTIDAPASSRGIRVQGRIKKVNTKDAALPNTTAKS